MILFYHKIKGLSRESLEQLHDIRAGDDADDDRGVPPQEKLADRICAEKKQTKCTQDKREQGQRDEDRPRDCAEIGEKEFFDEGHTKKN